MNGSSRVPPAKLRWRCRRGMQELDVMLGGWLEQAWPQADSGTREAFERLLEMEDDRLWDWFLGHARPDAGLEDIVESIRARHFKTAER